MFKVISHVGEVVEIRKHTVHVFTMKKKPTGSNDRLNPVLRLSFLVPTRMLNSTTIIILFELSTKSDKNSVRPRWMLDKNNKQSLLVRLGCPSLCQSVCVLVCLSIIQPFHQPACLSTNLSVTLPVHLSFSLTRQ